MRPRCSASSTGCRKSAGVSAFHATVVRCSAAWAECLVASDGARQGVVVAVEAGSSILLGEARWARDGEASSQAELAIAVADDWQGRGLADELMAALLVSARAAGISCLVADVLHDNERVQSFLYRHNFAFAVDAGYSLRLQLKLGPRDAAAGARRPAWHRPAPCRASILDCLFGGRGTA